MEETKLHSGVIVVYDKDGHPVHIYYVNVK